MDSPLFKSLLRNRVFTDRIMIDAPNEMFPICYQINAILRNHMWNRIGRERESILNDLARRF